MRGEESSPRSQVTDVGIFETRLKQLDRYWTGRTVRARCYLFALLVGHFAAMGMMVGNFLSTNLRRGILSNWPVLCTSFLLAWFLYSGEFQNVNILSR